jgi:hypothetical protein
VEKISKQIYFSKQKSPSKSFDESTTAKPKQPLCCTQSAEENKNCKKIHTKRFPTNSHKLRLIERETHTDRDPPQIPDTERERERERERNGNLGIDTLLLYLLVRRKEKSGGKGTRGACCGGKKNKSKSKEQEQIVSFKWDCGYSTWRSMSPPTELITRTR